MSRPIIGHGKARIPMQPIPPHLAPFTPDEISAAEIEAAREDGYLAGLREAAGIAWMFREQWKAAAGFHNFATAALNIATAIEAKAKEALK